MRRTVLSPLVAAAALMLGWSSAQARTLDVVASFSILADVASNVGGEGVKVTSLVPSGGDPHDFEPTPDDAKRVKAADVVFVNGLGLDGWMARLVKASGSAKAAVVASAGVQVRKMEEGGKTVTDPHVWNDPANVLVWIANIEKALAAADPENAATYKANAERYGSQVRRADADAEAAFSAIPQAKRKVLTSHEALGYFGAAYGVTFLAPLGLSTENEPSAATVAKLIDQIKREGVAVYFIETSNDRRLVEQIARATGARPGGDLHVESLSAGDGPAPTYLKMFMHNVAAIAAAVGKN